LDSMLQGLLQGGTLLFLFQGIFLFLLQGLRAVLTECFGSLLASQASCSVF